jgi:hypothetical protein
VNSFAIFSVSISILLCIMTECIGSVNVNVMTQQYFTNFDVSECYSVV